MRIRVDDFFDLFLLCNLALGCNCIFLVEGAGIAARRIGHEFEMKLHQRRRIHNEVRAGMRGAVARGQCLRVRDAAAIIDGKDLGEGIIDAFDQRGRAAEVRLELNGIEEQRKVVGNLEADLLNARKELGIGVAEEVDGLHGVADDETGAALALRARPQ